MKKSLCIFASVLFLALGLSACTKTPPAETQTPPEALNGNILVAYFSCTNTTKSVAEKIAASSGATLCRIEPKIPYSSADLNYNDDDCRANKEQGDPSSRPEISGDLPNISQYDTIFLGYPIWWGTLPKIIYTFLDSYDLSGKTIVPFCTSGGSGIATSVSAIKQEEPDATVLDGRRFSSGAAQSEIDAWVESLGVKNSKKETAQIVFTIKERRLAATLENNAAATDLIERLKTASIVIDMSDYGGFEKVGDFGFDLPTSDRQTETQPCDFVLYQGNKLVIFYGSNSWSYTRLGKITGVTPEELKSVLGSGNVRVTLSLPSVSASANEMDAIAALDRNEKHDWY